MSNVKIDITVDTEKLQAQFPKGGEITDRTIVVMTDDQTDSIYKDSDGGKYKDKLTSAADPGDNIFWEINAKNGKDKLVLIKCNESAELSDMLAEQPTKIEDKGKKKWKAKLKDGLGKSVAGFYTYKFAFEGETSKNWEWDPTITTRPPE